MFRRLGRRVKAIVKAAPPSAQMVLIEFECMTEGCDFQTLSLTDAHSHIMGSVDGKFHPNSPMWHKHIHKVEPRGYYYPKEPK